MGNLGKSKLIITNSQRGMMNLRVISKAIHTYYDSKYNYNLLNKDLIIYLFLLFRFIMRFLTICSIIPLKYLSITMYLQGLRVHA